MTADRQEMLDIVCRTAIAAGEAILKIYAKEFDVHHKTDKTPVTEADLAAERIILDRLMSASPTFRASPRNCASPRECRRAVIASGRSTRSTVLASSSPGAASSRC